MPIKYDTPNLNVHYIDDDGKEKTYAGLQTVAADQFGYDMIRKNTPGGLPARKDAPELWVYILAYRALRRKNKVGDALTWDKWIEQRLLAVEFNLTDEQQEAFLAQKSEQ